MIKNGFKEKDLKDDSRIQFQYYNYHHRLIEALKWEVFYSNEFSCPDEYKDGLQFLINKLENGEDITPHLSRRIKLVNFDDDLLNEWNIYHLHLGTIIEDDGFIERTEFVLYLYKKQNQLFLLDVLDHNNFNNQSLVTIIHKNWPKLIERFLLKEATGLTRPVSNEDIKGLRKAHVVSFIEPMPGIVYMPMGMGNTTSGIALEVVRKADEFMYYIRELERVAIQQINNLVSKNVQLKSRKKIFTKLVFDNDIPYALITNIPGIRIKLIE